jgi:Mg-chelatase subunit ChlD
VSNPRSRAWLGAASSAVILGALSGHGPGWAGSAGLPEPYRLSQTWRLTDNQSSVPPFGQAEGLDVASDGAIYVADSGRGVVDRLTAGGTLGASWDTGQDVGSAVDVAVTTCCLFVVGDEGGEVKSLDGSVIRSWSQTGITGVAADASGTAYVARTETSAGQDRAVIDVRDADGNVLTTWLPNLPIQHGAGLAVALDGRVYLAADGAVYIIRDGSVTGMLRVSHAFEGPPLRDVAVDREGRTYAVMGDGRVVHWHADGSPHVGLPVPIDQAQGLATDHSGGLVVSRGPAGLARITDRLSMDQVVLLASLKSPVRVAASAAGDVYVADALGRVQQWSSDGVVQDAWSDHRRLVPSEADPAHDVEWHDQYGFDVAALGDARCMVHGKQTTCLGRGARRAWQADAVAGGWFMAGTGSDAGLALIDFPGQAVDLLGADGMSHRRWQTGTRDAFASLSDIALGDDRVFVANRSAKRIEVRGLDGSVAGAIRFPGGARRLATTDGAVYALARQDDWIRKYDASGALVAGWVSAPDGGAADLAASAGGRVYVAAPKQGQVLVYEPGGSVDATPPELRESCRVVADKQAAPTSVALGETVTVRLAISGDCPDGSDSRADIVLIVDQSSHMGNAEWFSAMHGAALVPAQAAATAFLAELDPVSAQVAVIGMSNHAQVMQSLAANVEMAARAIAGMRVVSGGVDIADSLDTAGGELSGVAARTNVPHVVVMLTATMAPSQPALEAATRLRQRGVRVYTIGLGNGPDADLLRSIASSPEDYYESPSPADLGFVFDAIVHRVTSAGLLRSATVRDVLPPDMTLDGASVSPPATLTDRTLEWNLVSVPRSGVALTYQVRPRRSGVRLTNVSAELVYTDVMQVPGRLLFPVPSVTVRGPMPAVSYIPFAVREKHICKATRADVVLVFDVSTSMTAPAGPGDDWTKLDAALSAGQVFVDLINLPGDQVGVAVFSNVAQIVRPLTGSWAEVAAGLGRVRPGPAGTRIDLGLDVAGRESLGPRHLPANAPVILLLTDGLPSGDTGPYALSNALAIRSAGVTIFAVALGDDADTDLLSRIAGSPARVFRAPDANRLRAIYRQIAGMVVCPTG